MAHIVWLPFLALAPRNDAHECWNQRFFSVHMVIDLVMVETISLGAGIKSGDNLEIVDT